MEQPTLESSTPVAQPSAPETQHPAQQTTPPRNWHANASFQLKLVFLIIGIIAFVAWYLWVRFNA